METYRLQHEYRYQIYSGDISAENIIKGAAELIKRYSNKLINVEMVKDEVGEYNYINLHMLKNTMLVVVDKNNFNKIKSLIKENKKDIVKKANKYVKLLP